MSGLFFVVRARGTKGRRGLESMCLEAVQRERLRSRLFRRFSIGWVIKMEGETGVLLHSASARTSSLKMEYQKNIKKASNCSVLRFFV